MIHSFYAVVNAGKDLLALGNLQYACNSLAICFLFPYNVGAIFLQCACTLKEILNQLVLMYTCLNSCYLCIGLGRYVSGRTAVHIFQP